MRASRILAGVLGALALAACGGGGGGSAPPSEDMTGYWLVYLAPSGAPDEVGPTPIYLSQTDAAIVGAGTVGSMSGNAFSLVANGGTFNVRFDGTATATTASGSVTFTGAISGSGSFRLERFTPTGSVTVNGTIGTEAVDITTTTGIGSRDYTDVMLTNLEEVEVCAADATQQFEINFSPPSALAGTSLSVPSAISANVVFRRGAAIVDTDASAGTLTVTSYGPNGFAGSFSLTLAAGGTITGSFDVSFDIACYDP